MSALNTYAERILCIGPAAEYGVYVCVDSVCVCVYMYDIVYKRGCVYSVEYMYMYMYVYMCRVIRLKAALTLWLKAHIGNRPRC